MAPNPIDFDKVFSADLSENFVVLLVVCLLFGFYFLLIAIARRFDKKDLDKVRGLGSTKRFSKITLGLNFFYFACKAVTMAGADPRMPQKGRLYA